MSALPTIADPRPAPGFDRRVIPDSARVDHWTASDGWPLRRIRWAPPDIAGRGSILFVGGRGDHFEKYLESFEDWRGAGWVVESVDWRGQGGSGRTSPDPHVGDIPAFSVWIDDYAAYVADWSQRTPAPHVLIGHSMGGHLVLRALAESRVAPYAAVLVAPMLGFTAPWPNPVGAAIARLMMMLGNPARAAWKVSEKPGSSMQLRQHLLTHDAARYADELYWHGAVPETLLGPASWRWIAQSYRSFIGLGRSGVLEGVTTPLLILAAADDKLVSTAATRRAAARLPNATLYVYGPDAAHEILRESDAIRQDALDRISAFIDATIAA